MSTDKFLDLDIRKLFEEHGIKDIELIQKQIQHESDRKKIELRTLVGERYRDLIQAADSIAQMKQTSESVVAKIVNIEKTFHDLQQKYLIGFKMHTEHVHSQRAPNQISDSVVMQIKILMDIPEQIWSAIDSKDFLLATQLFLLAQHINYSLKFEIGDANLASRYPIVSKQWGIINQFKSLIFNFCNDALQSVHLSKELAANCLAALVLLDGLNSADLLNRLISLRSQTIKSIVISESDLSVKNKIKLCLNVLMDTIPLISSCFIKYRDSQDGLVSMYINEIKDTNAFLMLSQLDLEEELIQKFLPLVAKNHKPFVQHELKKLPLANVQESVNAWFNWVKQLATIEVTKLLNLITSVKGIYSIREECLAVEIPENWDSTWDAFSLPSVNFWTEFFQPLLTARVKGILSDKLDVCLVNLKKDVSELLGKVSFETAQYPENDLRWFVWKDSPEDIPQKLMEGGTLDSKRPLLLKARAFSPNVVKLCENFENNLSEVLLHLKQYLYELEQTSAMKDDLLAADIYLTSNKFCDRTEIQEYLQSVSGKLIDDFVVFVKNECIIEKPKSGRQEVNAIVTARFLQAIPSMCSNFKECFTISRPTGITLTNMKWQEVCDKLKQESTLAWSVWAKCFTKVIHYNRNKYLIKETADELRNHTIITDWEKVIIEEEAEEGKRINSEILVPYQPAVHLQKFLAFVCQDLNKVIPHTIPKSILNVLINNVAVELFNYYYGLSTSLDIRQKQAIQILFDVKYISLLMVPRDNKLLVEQSNKVCNSVISKIDPFDFDVFYPFINTNVKKGVQRSLLIFGNLVPHMEQLHSVLGARIEHSDGFKSIKDPPGVLALCSGTPWFPPLAVTAPTKSLPVIQLPVPERPQHRRKQHPSKEHTRNDSTGSTIKSGAAAFFGAMGSDWFSTS
ncbi:conserved oligomeric Golgi complex subunit 1 isoform X1 [Nasonia vitripennis]|uniref:Conserved oligomeric Golgi complex subunit 1 n=1 Tax=Nasonia vitripennis TaxID=7425 RepID=A0A7M7QQ52_NASVI|nr:conserved oligomeric Golgi complex subunit 1 isoform X1 [Nasonia vitripennis]